MKLKIHPDTSAAIEQALRDVNGCSQAHTFTEFSEISLLAETAEMELTRLDLPAVHRKGARYCVTSGARVSNAYMRKNFSARQATMVQLERGGSAWFLVDARRAPIGQSGGRAHVMLTAAQNKIALDRFQAQYGVLPE